MDINKYKPMVSEWFSTFDEFNFLIREKDIVIQAGRNSLYFNKKEDGKYVYDGWNYHLGEASNDK